MAKLNHPPPNLALAADRKPPFHARIRDTISKRLAAAEARVVRRFFMAAEPNSLHHVLAQFLALTDASWCLIARHGVVIAFAGSFQSEPETLLLSASSEIARHGGLLPMVGSSASWGKYLDDQTYAHRLTEDSLFLSGIGPYSQPTMLKLGLQKYGSELVSLIQNG